MVEITLERLQGGFRLAYREVLSSVQLELELVKEASRVVVHVNVVRSNNEFHEVGCTSWLASVELARMVLEVVNKIVEQASPWRSWAFHGLF